MTEARELAIQALYEADQTDADDLAEDTHLPAKAARLVRGVLAHLDELDEAIAAASEHWRIDRMPAVDRAILRLGLYELRYEPETPVGVVLSEAVRIAQLFSTERSGRFVNGVLATLAAAGSTEDGG